jgi:PHP family Zn ribbon phosphoesterase
MEALVKVVDAPMAEAIVKVRNGKAKVTPGYDGVYGQLVLGVEAPAAKPKPALGTVKQMNMSDFFGK